MNRFNFEELLEQIIAEDIDACEVKGSAGQDSDEISVIEGTYNGCRYSASYTEKGTLNIILKSFPDERMESYIEITEDGTIITSGEEIISAEFIMSEEREVYRIISSDETCDITISTAQLDDRAVTEYSIGRHITLSEVSPILLVEIGRDLDTGEVLRRKITAFTKEQYGILLDESAMYRGDEYIGESFTIIEESGEVSFELRSRISLSEGTRRMYIEDDTIVNDESNISAYSEFDNAHKSEACEILVRAFEAAEESSNAATAIMDNDLISDEYLEAVSDAITLFQRMSDNTRLQNFLNDPWSKLKVPNTYKYRIIPVNHMGDNDKIINTILE